MGTVLNNFKNLTNMWMNYKLLKLFIKIKSLLKPIWAFYFLCYNFKKIIKMEGYDGV